MLVVLAQFEQWNNGASVIDSDLMESGQIHFEKKTHFTDRKNSAINKID